MKLENCSYKSGYSLKGKFNDVFLHHNDIQLNDIVTNVTIIFQPIKNFIRCTPLEIAKEID